MQLTGLLWLHLKVKTVIKTKSQNCYGILETQTTQIRKLDERKYQIVKQLQVG